MRLSAVRKCVVMSSYIFLSLTLAVPLYSSKDALIPSWQRSKSVKNCYGHDTMLKSMKFKLLNFTGVILGQYKSFLIEFKAFTF
jgi:hypothetical protein